jgi:uncharacterized repeat protein (TIGR01451 family)
MIKILRITYILIFLSASYFCNAQVIRPFTARFTAASEKGNIRYIANSISTVVNGNTSEVAPAGSSTNNSGYPVFINIQSTNTAIVNYGEVWKYWDQGTRPTFWGTPSFVPGAWPTGAGQLGYGDGDETTVVGFGGNAANKYITTYFSKTVNIVNAAAFADYTLGVKRDDGIVVYINGVERYRNNMTGVVNNTTLAYEGTPGNACTDDGNTEQSIILPNSFFSNGNNNIDVEVHQNSVTSSDLSFDLRLVGNIPNTSSIIPLNSTWKYWDQGTRPAAWETPGFNDAAWLSGPAQLGYGDGDEATVIGYGGNAAAKYITSYFRKQVNITNPSQYGKFIINIKRDDGIVVYVNGVIVLANNIDPNGTIDNTTLSQTSVDGANENTLIPYEINNGYFINGTNTIAVEIHQIDAANDDVTFDLSLEAFTPSIYNSSSADLNVAPCSEIIFAGLYWGTSLGGRNDAIWRTSKKDTVMLKLPGSSSFQTIVAQVKDLHNFGIPDAGQNHVGYQNFADITSLLNVLSPNGTYTVGNILLSTGFANTASGWTIVIAYKNNAEIVRNLVVFDGMAQVGGLSSLIVDIPFAGFKTPASGPVSCQLGVVCYDGDRSSPDGFLFKQDSNAAVGSYYNLTTAPAPNTSALDDAWNSTISYLGNNVTTRNPAYNNTNGYDADIVDVPNVGNVNLGNNATSGRIRLSSTSEKYFLHVVTTATATRDPLIQIQKTSADVNGGVLIGGDELKYTIAYRNNGNDSSINTFVYDTIPVGTSYKLNSIQINGIAKTDAAGDDEAEYDFVSNRVVWRIGIGANATTGGRVLTSGASNTGNVSFSVNTSVACSVRSCSNPVSNVAWVTYTGPSTKSTQTDVSVKDVSGCFVNGGVTNIVNGPCAVAKDTIIAPICPIVSVLIPASSYFGYRFYTALPFTTSTLFNPTTLVTNSSIIYGYFDGPGLCDDTINISIFIPQCPDIDDDNDGLPDFLEINNPVALDDHDLDGILNWCDANYPIFIDNNGDTFNDYFDPSADADNDGIINFLDVNFAGFIDVNGDNVNDNMDKDLDGIPNHLDIDSDNDGIPDTVESFGVDANGDGKIDNYTDTDADGFSQNVDGNNTGVYNSTLGLGALNTDGDALPNYLDLDSDNDGIPDIVEAFGVDGNNNAKVDIYIDNDLDGLSDIVDGDVGNDLIAENSAATLLRTSADGNSDGKTDTWPFKNMDRDSKPSPYDLDSDDDGIADVIEAGNTDADYNGRVDGALNADQWNLALSLLATLNLPNFDNNGRPNVYDIDSDGDGIPDNIEGQPTATYALPSASDNDNDGLKDTYDNFVGFGGNGINPYDRDADTYPDYIDLDTDSDGLLDIIEGNDLNFNDIADDVVLTGLDTDGDGLDDFFDLINSSTKGTSGYLGDLGSSIGDASPGSKTTVQRTYISLGGCSFERDWRCITTILNCNYLSFTGQLNNDITKLQWKVICEQEINFFTIERSINSATFIPVGTVQALTGINVQQDYTTTDNVTGITADKIYYRLKSTGKNGKVNYSSIITLANKSKNLLVDILPMPVKQELNVVIASEKNITATIQILNTNGEKVFYTTANLHSGSNYLTNKINLPNGIYVLVIDAKDIKIAKKLTVLN